MAEEVSGCASIPGDFVVTAVAVELLLGGTVAALIFVFDWEAEGQLGVSSWQPAELAIGEVLTVQYTLAWQSWHPCRQPLPLGDWRWRPRRLRSRHCPCISSCQTNPFLFLHLDSDQISLGRAHY